jgi:beta-N-acetylhexosaminidase
MNRNLLPFINFTRLAILTSAVQIFCLTGCAENKEISTKEASDWAQKTLANLTIEKKVAQLICVDISGTYLPEDDPRFESWLKLAGQYGIGGFVLYGGTPYYVAHLLNRLQKEAEIPLLISADFEGGPGQQVTGASEFPANMAFSATQDENLMYRAAKIMAEEGRAMGIHLTYTPVADVSVFPDNPGESVRSFGGDIEQMRRFLKAYIKGYKETGMLTTAKHFPGRGGMKKFADFPGFTYLEGSAKEINQNEFMAFKYAIDAGVNFIMTEHIAVPSVTGGSKLPASVEPLLVDGIIRKQLGFEGIITTDDLWYEHVTSRFGAEEVALKALEAGHDILLKPKDPVATIQAVVDAVKKGRISEAQIDSSVYKLLVQKALLGLHRNSLVDVDRCRKIVGTVGHQQLVKEVADRSITLLKNEGVFPLSKWDPGHTVHITIQKTEDQPVVRELAQKLTSAFEGIANYSLKPGLGDPDYEKIKSAADQAELVILSFFVQRERYKDPAPVSQDDLKLIDYIINTKPGKVIAISYGNPFIINKIKKVPAFLICYGEGGWYGNQTVYFDSFTRILKGKLIPSGKLPVLVASDYPIGYGLTY